MTYVPNSGPDEAPEAAFASRPDAKSRIIEALMALAAERSFEDISISQIAERADVSLADFRDQFPSKGAILAAFSKKIDRQVLEGAGQDLLGEPAKDRLFDVLMRRLDAMTPYRTALEGIVEWAKREPLAATALNGVALNSMRFMLEAAGIDSEGTVGALKLQGLVIAWTRILDVWFRDEDPGLARTMAALDKELQRGDTLVRRAEDLNRLASPFRSIARALIQGRPRFSGRTRERWRDEDVDQASGI
jgi:AcrR family transcriptional regulator